jgi:hypothetical protein
MRKPTFQKRFCFPALACVRGRARANIFPHLPHEFCPKMVACGRTESVLRKPRLTPDPPTPVLPHQRRSGFQAAVFWGFSHVASLFVRSLSRVTRL